MSAYFFGSGNGRIDDDMARRADTIARRHDATLTPYNDPARGWRYWFKGPNRGAPFDGAMARAVAEEIEQEIGKGIDELGS